MRSTSSIRETARSIGDFADLNSALLARVMEFRPDVMFCVLMHYEIWFETLDLIHANSPVLVVNWGTDDSWKFDQTSRFFAEHVDLHVTTDFAAADTARALGLLNVLLSQWAGSAANVAAPCPSRECLYDVSFVGSMYGDRAEWIAALRASGIAVSCFGHGTENGVVDATEIPKILRASRISLNFSGPGKTKLAARAADRAANQGPNIRGAARGRVSADRGRSGTRSLFCHRPGNRDLRDQAGTDREGALLSRPPRNARPDRTGRPSTHGRRTYLPQSIFFDSGTIALYWLKSNEQAMDINHRRSCRCRKSLSEQCLNLLDSYRSRWYAQVHFWEGKRPPRGTKNAI